MLEYKSINMRQFNLRIFVALNMLLLNVNFAAEIGNEPTKPSTDFVASGKDTRLSGSLGDFEASSCNCTAFQVLLEQTNEWLGKIFRKIPHNVEVDKDSSADNSIPRDCSEAPPLESGVYTIQPVPNGQLIKVYCDMETDGGGWTVFQRRQDGTVDFYRTFKDYRQGFGDLDGEFWLGNDYLHLLTAQRVYQLRVDLTDFEGKSAYAVYEFFHVGDLADNYKLTVLIHSGTAGDSLSSYHNGMSFTTKDRDNDLRSDENCAKSFHGGWWYNSCYEANLNGEYGYAVGATGVVWMPWKYALKTSEMKIRVKS